MDSFKDLLDVPKLCSESPTTLALEKFNSTLFLVSQSSAIADVPESGSDAFEEMFLFL